MTAGQVEAALGLRVLMGTLATGSNCQWLSSC